MKSALDISNGNEVSRFVNQCLLTLIVKKFQLVLSSSPLSPPPAAALEEEVEEVSPLSAV